MGIFGGGWNVAGVENGGAACGEWRLNGAWWRVARFGGNGGMLVWVNRIDGLCAFLAIYPAYTPHISPMHPAYTPHKPISCD